MNYQARNRTLMVLVVALASCQQRLVDGEIGQEGLRVCTYVNMARVYDENGNPVAMVLSPLGGNSEICTCMALEDKLEGVLDEWFNDQAYARCIEDATSMGYPEAHDCEYWYEQGQWIKMIQVPPGEENVRCNLDAAEPIGGCSVQ